MNTDIKRVLAFSTCSQLGYMMLALGVGGWASGLFHLLTHAVFKALLFLSAGSVIHGTHHEQDLRKMGGLRKTMPITAFCMLIGVLAISGAPLFSGWYSKDQLLASALGYALAEHHYLLFLVPLFTAGLTAFYMFRLWYLAFWGEARDAHVAEHAHESPLIMTAPLLLLALLSLGVAWGWPLWDADASYLGKMLHSAQPAAHAKAFHAAREAAEHNHLLAGGLALAAALAGAGWAYLRYARQAPSTKQLAEPRGLFAERWYFDLLYRRLFVRPTLQLASTTAKVDKQNSRQGISLDGILNKIAEKATEYSFTLRFTQTGRIRNYVLALLALALVGLSAVAVLAR